MKCGLRFLPPILLCVCLVCVSCKKTGDSSEPAKPSKKAPAPSEMRLSLPAGQVADLLDKGRYAAAESLLDHHLRMEPGDVGLYCQYVRFLIGAYDIEADPFIPTPINTNDKYRVSSVVRQAVTLAVEFDPEARPSMAEIILRGVYEQIRSRADKGVGYIHIYTPNSLDEGIDGEYHFLGLAGDPSGFLTVDIEALGVNEIVLAVAGRNHIELAWIAIEIGPEVAKKWAPQYESLVPQFAKTGCAISAMYTGNLAGDLATEAQGDTDFEKATQGFCASVESGKCEAETLRDTTRIYVRLFSAECKKASSGLDADYLQLLGAIRAKGGDLGEFEERNLIPKE